MNICTILIYSNNMNVQLTQRNQILLNEAYMTCLLKCSKSFPPVLAIYIYIFKLLC